MDFRILRFQLLSNKKTGLSTGWFTIPHEMNYLQQVAEKVLDSLDSAKIARLFLRSMPVSRPDTLATR